MFDINRNFFVFGNCAASQVALGLNYLRNDGQIAKDIDIGYWAMPANYFNEPDSYCYFKENVVIRNLHEPRNIRDAQGILNPHMDKTMTAYQTLPRNIRIPFDSWNPIYVYATPIFPFATFRMIMEKYNEYLPSLGMIEDIVRNLIIYQIELLRFLKALNIDLIVVEGIRLFQKPIDMNAYNIVTAIYVSVIKNLIHELDLPLLEYDKLKFMNKFGFTKDEFRKSPDDCIHANDIYGKHVAINLIKFIEKTDISLR